MAFCNNGLGIVLARCFDEAALERPEGFPNTVPRGRTLLIAADFSGSHAGQLFDTYSFLVLDLDRNRSWVEAQRVFRRHIMPNRRRMAFKKLNDKLRRNALMPFLALGGSIEGWLVSFAVSKDGGSAFEHGARNAALEEQLSIWKPAVQERLLRILHLAAFLLSGLSGPNQDVLFVTDHDEINANTAQLTRFTELFAHIVSNSIAHNLGHLRCATAQSDDGSLWLEDMLAVPDLAAGTVCEVATSMAGHHRYLQKSIISPAPASLSWKSRYIVAWLAADALPLQRLTCFIDLPTTARKGRATMLRWHAFPGLIQT